MHVVKSGLLVVAAALFGAAAALGGSGTALAQPAYYPFGPQIDVPEGNLEGWTQCWHTTYNIDHTDPGNALDTVLEDCDGDYLMLASRPVGSTVFDVLAAAPRADVITDTGLLDNTPHNANGTGWYFNPGTNSFSSWGFAPEGDVITRTECDTTETDDPYRLCWHTFADAISYGWRSGDTTNLNDSTDFERFIFTSDGAGDLHLFKAKHIATAAFLIGQLSLSEGSDGIEPGGEDFTLVLGEESSIVVPAGSLLGHAPLWTGVHEVGSTQLRIWLVAIGHGRYLLIIFGNNVKWDSPGDIGVLIGDDAFGQGLL